jgi:hypothetical protein
MNQQLTFNVQPTATHTWTPQKCIIQRWEDAGEINGVPHVKLHTVLIQEKERGSVTEISEDIIPKAMFESAIAGVDKLTGKWTLDMAVVNQLFGLFDLELDQ